MTNLIDFAPGENHIALRNGEKTYYVPELFHLSTTYTSCVELLIQDIVEAVPVDKIYGPWGYYNRNVLIINNHPIKKIKVFGRIIGEIYREIESGNDFVIVTIDDSSGLSMKVKMLEAKYTGIGLSWGNNYGKIIECTGILQATHYQGSRVLLPDFVEVVGTKYDFGVELKCWEARLESREILAQPWVFTPPTNAAGGIVLSSFDPVVKLRNDAIRNMKWSESIPRAPAEDSYQINKKKEKETKKEQEIYELIDEEEVYEVEEEVFHEQADNDIILISSQEISTLDATEEIEDSLPLHKSRMNLSFDDVQIIEVKDSPLYYVTEFELSLQFVRFIMDKQFTKLKLADIYNDFYIHELLENLTRVQIACAEISQADLVNIDNMKKLIFHRIRHNLHMCNLIQVTKNQTIHAQALQKIQHDLKSKILHHTSLHVPSLKQLYDDGTTSHIEIKLLNGIVDYVLTEILNQRTKWKYDMKSKIWLKINTHI